MTASLPTIAALRFGCGLRPDQPPPQDAAALLRELDAPDAPLVSAREAGERHAAFFAFSEARRKARKGDAEAGKLREALGKAARQRVQRDERARIIRAATTAQGFRERLHRFWCDHFTVARRTPLHAGFVTPMQELAIRPHVAGRFDRMLRAVTMNPAMLLYLDQNSSAGPNSALARRNPRRGLNENLAREILELHTLGVSGPYDQADVREFARVLAGFSFDEGGFRFRERLAEPGAKTVLGRRYAGFGPQDALDLLDRLAVHPSTARHLARKMAVHFVSDAPSDDLVDAMARAYARGPGGDLRAMTAAMLDHREAWTWPGGPTGKVKKPWDLVVSGLRAANVSARDLAPNGVFPPRITVGALRAMGQPMDRAPGPDGWKEEATHWITPGGMAARLDWAGRMGRILAPRVDPRVYAANALRDAMGRETAFAVKAAAEKWEGVALLLVSPDFNRR